MLLTISGFVSADAPLYEYPGFGHSGSQDVRYPKLEELPSFYFRRQGGVTFQHDAVGIANRGKTGDQCLMWGSDYPHPEGTFPRSREVLDEQFADVQQDSIDRITWKNAVELYGIATPEGFGA